MINEGFKHLWHDASRTTAALCAVMLAAAVAATGCNDGRPARVPVSGEVLIDGKPLPGAFVSFYPLTGRPSNGRTDSSGRFVLGCFDDADGAQLGTHQVTIIAVEEINPNTMRWFAPKAYANHQTSGLEYTIDRRTDDLKIELTWNGGQPFVERFAGGD
jgi:hypothetical protein